MANQQLVDYLKSALQAGVAKADLEKALVSQGWPQKDVDEAFASLLTKPASLSQPVSTPPRTSTAESKPTTPADPKPATTTPSAATPAVDPKPSALVGAKPTEASKVEDKPSTPTTQSVKPQETAKSSVPSSTPQSKNSPLPAIALILAVIGIITVLIPFAGIGIGLLTLLVSLGGFKSSQKGLSIVGFILGLLVIAASGGHYYYGTTQNYTGLG